jgi:hypothetical protein
VSAAAESAAVGRRDSDHYPPCGGLQVLDSKVADDRKDIEILYKRVDRLPNWMVMLWGAMTAITGGLATAVFFMANQLVQAGVRLP